MPAYCVTLQQREVATTTLALQIEAENRAEALAQLRAHRDIWAVAAAAAAAYNDHEIYDEKTEIQEMVILSCCLYVDPRQLSLFAETTTEWRAYA